MEPREEEEESKLLRSKLGKIAGHKSAGLTSSIPYIFCSPLNTFPFFCLAVRCTCSAASTASCSATSSCTPRRAAPPSPARRPAARPGRGSTASGTAPRGPACPGRATLSEANSRRSYRPPATHAHVGDTAFRFEILHCHVKLIRDYFRSSLSLSRVSAELICIHSADVRWHA